MKTPIKMENLKVTLYEAVIVYKNGDERMRLTEKSLEALQLAIDVWTRCGKYDLKEANKIERNLVKLVG